MLTRRSKIIFLILLIFNFGPNCGRATADESGASVFGKIEPIEGSHDSVEHISEYIKHHLRVGAIMARQCFTQASKNNDFRGDQYRSLVHCVDESFPNVSYLEKEERIEAASEYITAYFITLDSFFDVPRNPRKFGASVISAEKLQRAEFEWANLTMKEFRVSKYDLCETVEWVKCSILP